MPQSLEQSRLRRLGWTSDIHLNFVSLSEWDSFVGQVRDAQVSGLLLTGDISEAEDVVWQLQRLLAAIDVPIYFVLGNHDYYHGSIGQVRREVAQLCSQEPRLFYLTAGSPILLEEGWVLCGNDGWADTRVGDYYRSSIQMNDFRVISDLKNLSLTDRHRKLRRLGVECALHLGKQLEQASSLGTRLLVITHVPPFRESCWYEGQHSDDNWAPFFICGAVGWMLKRFCRSHPQHRLLVLCGHTHHGGRADIMDNLQVWTGHAVYGVPRLCSTLNLSDLEVPMADWTYRTE